MSMPKGQYYIGDLCYVLHDEWKEVCDLLFGDRDDYGCNQGEFNLADGRRFTIFNTAYGDGLFDSNGFGVYGVDAGSIGCILLKDIDLKNARNNPELGNIVIFDTDFTTSTDGATLTFGHVQIYTGDMEEEEDEYYED